eukprot:4283484-Pleurochrysis_carterae.AAC.3
MLPTAPVMRRRVPDCETAWPGSGDGAGSGGSSQSLSYVMARLGGSRLRAHASASVARASIGAAISAPL